jgi:hypothetical protein
VDPVVGRARAVRVAKVVCALGLVAVVCVGLGRLRRHVYGLAEYRGPVRLELVDLPDWLERDEHRHIVESVIAAAGLSRGDAFLDGELVGRVGRQMARSGWIRRIVGVEKCYGRVIRVRCEFRTPLAWAMHGDYCYLIDGEGVRLPGRYSHVQVKGAGLVQLAGVHAGPPVAGAPWVGEDLRAGVELAALLEGCAFRGQVRGVLVHNYGGRENSREAHIELATDRPGSRIRWGRAPGCEVGIEPSAGEKIALLRGLYRRYQRIDMGRSYVDVRRSAHSVDVAAESGVLVGGLRS